MCILMSILKILMLNITKVAHLIRSNTTDYILPVITFVFLIYFLFKDINNACHDHRAEMHNNFMYSYIHAYIHM